MSELSANEKNLEEAYQSLKLSERIRAKMINWMIQVFRVMAKSTDNTLFLAVSIMDRFIFQYSRIVKEGDGQCPFSSEGYRFDFHKVGLVCIWISSKLEDIIPIYIS